MGESKQCVFNQLFFTGDLYSLKKFKENNSASQHFTTDQ